jgi:hypothetical protein
MRADRTQADAGRFAARDTVGRGFSRSLRRAWGTEKGRRRLIYLAVLVVVMSIIGFGAFEFSSLSSQTQSYRDGYSAGGSAYASYGSETAQQACKLTELRGPRLGGIPAGNSPTQWLQGCVAGFDAARADD